MPTPDDLGIPFPEDKDEKPLPPKTTPILCYDCGEYFGREPGSIAAHRKVCSGAR